MTAFVLIIFSLATLKTITPFVKKENYTVANIIIASAHIVALWHLFALLVALK